MLRILVGTPLLGLGPLVVALLVTVAGIPDPRALTVTTRRAATTVWVKGCWKAAGAPDAILTSVTGPTPASHVLAGTATCDSFSTPAPAPLATITGAFRVQSRRRTLLSNVVSRAWSYTEPDAPPPDPVIDSLMVRPASFTVEATVPGVAPGPKNRQQLCAFVGFRSGRVGFRQLYEGDTAECRDRYQALPATVRAVSAAEQAMADATCVQWSATGGTITGEACGPNPAVRYAPFWKSTVVAVTITPAPAPAPRVRARDRLAGVS